MSNRVTILGLIVTAVIISFFALTAPLPVQAASRDGGPTAYIVLVDKLSINDIDASTTPALYQLTRQGAVGLASNRTLRGHNTIDCSLTLGAGNLARGYLNGLLGFNYNESVPGRNKTAAQLYKGLTGTDAEDGTLLLVNYPEIVAGMEAENVNTVPGALGEILRSHRLQVCVLGNGDTGMNEMRAGIAVGMDARGQVPMGDVGPGVRDHLPDSFMSYETNYTYVLEQVDKYESRADLIILDLSDLARLEAADTALPARTESEKQMLMKKIDQTVAGLVKGMDPDRDLLLVAGISPSAAEINLKNNFTPVLAYGHGFTPGILTSATSKRDYVVANTDIAPTVLKFFHLTDEQRVMIGQGMTSKPAGEADNLETAKKLASDTSAANRLRPVVIKGYVILQIIIIFLALMVIFLHRRGKRVIRPIIISMVAVPLVLLPLNKIPMPGDWAYVVAAVVMIAAVTWLAILLCRKNAYRSFVLISSITVLLLDLDIILGSPMIKSSLLGYDPTAGARYYGIGNEYMGILIGASIAIAAYFYEKFQNRWVLTAVALFFALECYLIAGPSLGANSDGILTAPTAFLVTYLLLRQVKMNPKVIAGVLGGVLLVAAGGTLYDMCRPAELQTHIGRAANQVFAGGWQEILLIIKRKMSMNIKLIRYTIWSYVFLVVLLVVSLLLVRPVGAMQKLRQQRPYIFKGFIGVITAAVVALMVNDSGIVAASTTSIYLVFPMLLLMMNINEDELKTRGIEEKPPTLPRV
ncbi:MAG TPA: hypothetical protein VN441_17390 [Syntrophomonas sp.]|nr:hypothetical protein [Syntrophomonas sp.]